VSQLTVKVRDEVYAGWKAQAHAHEMSVSAYVHHLFRLAAQDFRPAGAVEQTPPAGVQAPSLSETAAPAAAPAPPAGPRVHLPAPDRPLDGHCFNAALHWRLAPGERCRYCGGQA